MNITENQFRDYLFENHKDDMSVLLRDRREPINWRSEEFPPLRIFLQQIAEKKINKSLDGIHSLTLSAKELRLEKIEDSTTRIDLFGNSELNGITIIELKKSKQTERQAFTELLAYANHFCSIFPGLKENSITSILISPMETRTVRDAFAQELLMNNKNIVALIPKEDNENITLSVYYPDESYYHWFENNLLNDQSMSTVAIAFPIIDGWIDLDIDNEERSIPNYSKEALNTISSEISHKLEAEGVHSLVYASQKWGEIAKFFPYPNIIFIAAINPFSSFRTYTNKNNIQGESNSGRLSEVQAIYDQLHSNEREFWLDGIASSFHDYLIRTAKKEFERCTISSKGEHIDKEISLPDWYGVKTSMFEAVFTHNLDIYLSGLIREIYISYINHIFLTEEEAIYYGTDLPKFSYETLREFLPVWSILAALGLVEEYAQQ